MRTPPSITEPQERYGGFLIEAEFVPMPEENLRVFARSLLPDIQRDFADPAFEAQFQNYLKNKEAKKHV